MANFTITLKAQTLDLFGPSPSTQWTNFKWGTGTWGQKAAGVSGLPALVKSVGKSLQAQSFTPTDSMSLLPIKVISDRLSFATRNVASGSLIDAKGYYYVFYGPTTDAENKPTPIYSIGTTAASGWSISAGNSTSWS